MKRNNNILKVFALIALQFFMINNVYAAGFFEPSSGDLSVTVLKNLFGGLMGGGSDPLQEAIKIFNSSILIVGGILVAYTIVMGTVGTAHDGEMMGKKFSSVWVPIRTALGTALVLPTINGAYCLMQAIVMWLVLQGVGLADAVWGAYMNNPALGANLKASIQSQDKILQFVEQTFFANVCVEANKQIIDKIKNDPESGILASSWASTYNYDRVAYTNADKKVWKFGNQNSNDVFLSKTGCGSIDVNKPPTITVNNSEGKLTNFENKMSNPALNPIYTAHDNAIKTVVNSTKTLAQKFVQDSLNSSSQNVDIDYAAIQNIAKAYEQTILQAGQAYIAQTEPFKHLQETANKEGWFMAGSWFIKLININAATSSSINNIPSATFNREILNRRGASEEVTKVYSMMESSLARVSPGERSMTSASKGEKQSEIEGAKSSTDLWDKIMVALAEKFTKINLLELKDDNRHPIIILQEMGNRLLNATLVTVGALGVLAAGGALVIGLGDSVIAAAIVILPILAPLITTLLGLSFFLSYFLPMMPFIIWMGALVGWLIMVVEAIIAAPLWAVMHLHPSGDDMTGKGGNGYMLVLGLLLRPTLMVFGFIAAVALLQVMGEFVNTVFFEVFLMSQNSQLGIFGILFGLMIYAGMMFQLIKTMLSVIHAVPDQLLRWIGGGGEQLGQYAGQMSQGTQAGYAAAAGMTAAGLGGAASKVIGAGQQLKSLQQQDVQNETLKQNNASQFDKSYGAGANQEKNETMGISNSTPGMLSGLNPGSWKSQKEDAKKEKAYATGIQQAQEAGGLEGVQEFQNRMQEAKENNFSNYGGSSINAANAIGKEVRDEYTNQKLENLGSEASNFVDKKDGSLADIKALAATNPTKADRMAESRADTARKLESLSNNPAIGATGLSSILSKLNNDPSLGSKDLGKALNKELGSISSANKEQAKLKEMMSTSGVGEDKEQSGAPSDISNSSSSSEGDTQMSFDFGDSGSTPPPPSDISNSSSEDDVGNKFG